MAVMQRISIRCAKLKRAMEHLHETLSYHYTLMMKHIISHALVHPSLEKIANRGAKNCLMRSVQGL